VSNAEVGTVQETGTFIFVEIVVHNDGGRTALIEDGRVARYLGTDRETLWQDITEDVPGDWAYSHMTGRSGAPSCSAPVA
jgi:hypothetical protein